MDEAFLVAAPSLEAVFYGAGSIRAIAPPEFWRRGIVICSAWGANAVPVAEYALSQILFGLKRGWQAAAAMKAARGKAQSRQILDGVSGAYGGVVGIVSLGMIGRLVVEKLKPFDVRILAYDPYVAEAEARGLGVELAGLDDLFRQADVVSLHAPWLPETVGLIRGAHFAAMKPYATFINTARGAIVREEEMIETLGRRGDVWAVLDVTHPEPPVPDSPLWTLPNVTLTPHMAGSQGAECHRMGQTMLEELDRYLSGAPLRWQVTEEKARIMA
ncbi:MAG: D-3-phosphoglycerate dehydrogenase [candidate division BRC1 bacterium ADurb.BinA364]|nr:MAG: D-3-phosphoglycerate dehydrogenase [candidate division BRC1 bacterium ADurb.BinA364]